ncbi:sensor histidine kinase [Herbiconiux daphne]|uniref:histidine kinase n=1 Tax=Herbiconiux daphne TaxID=2970914 RepID=A0ABT2GZV8_9MICO|nr:HAMP domain-containing sensor histidine kinase [Herbiconiux daphne]MCS5732281.1 HAMP domain-containing histidine kinase [Herbiconiux daphne]
MTASRGSFAGGPAAPDSTHPSGGPLGRRPWSLRRRLVVGTAAIVAVVLLVVGIASVASLNASITKVVDTQLTGSMSALRHSVEKLRYGNGNGAGAASGTGSQAGTGSSGTGTGTGAGSGYVKPFVDYTGHGPGAIIALEDDGVIVDSARFSESDAVALPPAVVAELEASTLTAGTPQNIDLPGLGSYRVTTETDSEGNLLIAGVSMATVDAAVVRQTVVMSIMAVLALLIIVFGVIVVVRLALRPLDRVVGTAAEVASMPLDRGEVAITTRVGEADTDPRTEVGKVGDALNRLLAHVDDALAVRAATDKRMRRFVTDASHELRTPLASIQGYAELTRQDSENLPDITEYSLARIEAEAKRMNSLVSDLLLLARLDEGQDLHLDDIDLGEIVINVVSDAKASAPLHHWTADVPDAPALVQGDRERMHQLVLNLLSNAAVHTPDGTDVATSVTLVTGDDGREFVELRVSDNGPGITAELVPELFERFARGDSSRSRRAGSSGLGLAIVASIVEAHGGTIQVESVAVPTPGAAQGTTFTVRFERLGPHPGAGPKTPSRPEGATGGQGDRHASTHVAL